MAKKIKARELYEKELEILLAFPDLARKQNNWTKKQYDSRVKELQELINASKLGSMKRRKGSTYERNIAKKVKDKLGIALTRTPQSGGFAKNSEKAEEFRGDIVSLDKDISLNVHIECKAHRTLNLRSWYRQAREDCPRGLYPIVIFHEQGTSNDYVILDLEDFYNMSYAKTNTEIKSSKRTNIKTSKEVWKAICDYSNYFISNKGRVKSTKNNQERILRAGIDSSGYYVVGLCKDGKQKSFRVHQLVAKHFLGNSKNSIVNHIDGNKLNNIVSNLEYVTYSGNIQHAYNHNLRPKGEDIYCAKLSDREVLEIRKLLGFGVSRQELKEKYNVSSTTILRIANNIDYRNPNNLYILSKDHKTWKPKEWYKQASEDCPEGLYPIVIMHQAQENKEGKRCREAEDFVMIKLDDFLEMTKETFYRREEK